MSGNRNGTFELEQVEPLVKKKPLTQSTN